jgi:hypothetical protein
LELALTGKNKDAYFAGVPLAKRPLNECHLCEMVKQAKGTPDCKKCNVFVKWRTSDFSAECENSGSPYNRWWFSGDRELKKIYAREVYNLIAKQHRLFRRQKGENT